MRSISVRIIFLILLLLSSCNFFFRVHDDDFYNDTGSWDSGRLPLLKPYYLIFISQDYGWQMPVKGNFPLDQYDYNLGDLLDIKKVAVENNVVMVYTPYMRDLDKSLDRKMLHWFVMIPDKGNFEIGFENEIEFVDYIENLGVRDMMWVEPSVAYQQFSSTGCFDWIPDCE